MGPFMCYEGPSPSRGIIMTKKKETKKPSAKEKQKKIFDETGKLVINKMSEHQIDDLEKQVEASSHDSMKRVGIKPPQSLDELQEKKRQRWRQYYSQNKERYKQWNKNWRDKQKKEKQVKNK